MRDQGQGTIDRKDIADYVGDMCILKWPVYRRDVAEIEDQMAGSIRP
jgi:hypothetical protein